MLLSCTELDMLTAQFLRQRVIKIQYISARKPQLELFFKMHFPAIF